MGDESTPTPIVATPSSSSFSAVAAGSMMDLGPEQTSIPGVAASSSRSALTSGSSPGCTPPIPPVALIGMPARAAAQIVALTVVAPTTPEATAIGRSRRATFVARPGSANRASSPSSRPTTTAPSTTPTQAGTAPPRAIAALIRSMHSRFLGCGSP